MLRSDCRYNSWGVFSHIAIISGAPDTLLSIANLVRRGFEIGMSKLGIGVFLGDKLVFRGAIDREMFYMDIEELIQSRFKVAKPTSVEETPAQVPLSQAQASLPRS